MLPTNVMSFMKKMVTTADVGDSGHNANTDSGTALSKLRQTLSSSLMTAQETVTKLSPTRQPLTPESAAAVAALALNASLATEKATALNKNEEAASNQQNNNKMEILGRPRTGACRVCLKSFQTEDFFRICCECQLKVCEDCASYSKNEEGQDESKWRCSICRRKSQSRAQTQRTASASGALGLRNEGGSEGGLLDIPVGLQRRHSDVKLGSGNTAAKTPTGNSSQNTSTGLDIPRSPELRRHSDVSPASLKELEKVAGERREELRWEREMEWRAEQQGSRLKQRRAGGIGLPTPPAKFTVGDDPKSSESSLDDDIMTEEEAEWRRQQAQRGRMPSNAAALAPGARSPRRRSRVMQRQHSYDEEESAGAALIAPPFELPRRASAYDVYQTAGMAKMVDGGQDLSGRRPSFRVPAKPNGGYDVDDPAGQGFDSSPSPLSPEGPMSNSRRPSTQNPSVEINNSRRPSTQNPGVEDSSPSVNTPDWGGGLSVDEDRRGRRRSSAMELPGMRALPATPASGERRVSVLPIRVVDDNAETIRRQASVTAGEDIKIVIHDVDSDAALMRPGVKRRVMLRRDPSDKAHRSISGQPQQKARGFGLRVVGGKSGPDGRLFAYIVWTVPGGPADQAGLVQGDRVVEWNGMALTDRSFEEVCSVMDRTGDSADLLIEHFADMRISDLLDDANMAAAAAAAGAMAPRKSGGDAMGLQLDTDQDKGPTSPTRRKLPKTPEQLMREKTVSGRVQVQTWYLEERRELVVSVLAADDLAPREDTGYGTQPEAYVRLQIPHTNEPRTLKTDVAEPTHNPIWNATFEIANVPAEDLMKQTIEMSLWDYCPDRDSQFLGECVMELQKAFLEDRPVWYRLEDPRHLRLKSPHVSPRGSLANSGTAAREIAQRLLRRGDFQQQRSCSDDKEDEKGVSHSSSVESGLLHPDHCYLGLGSRRGSSQSEIIETDTYQLGRDFSRSLPGSRRSSFQNTAPTTEKEELIPTYSRERRRSSSARGNTHYEPLGREELLRNLKGDLPTSVTGRVTDTTNAGLSRTLSLSQDKRPARSGSLESELNQSHQSRSLSLNRPPLLHSGRALSRESVYVFRPSRYAHDILTGAAAALSRLDNQANGKRNSDDDTGDTSNKISLGPGQVQPRGYRFVRQAGEYGEVKLSLLMSKGQLEVEVVCAKGLEKLSKTDAPPDTYIKTYLKDGEKWLQKRKTKVFKSSFEPQYRQKLRYSACDVLGRGLLVMLWAKQKGFEHNLGLGGAELALDKLQLTQPTNSWYPIFPMNTLAGSEDTSNDSP